MEKKNTILYHPLSEEGKERWLFASGLDDMKTTGCYVVRLRHGAAGYGLPLENCGNSHYVVATLFVTDSGSDERLQVNRVLGQTIILPSCNDATTRIFSRTLSKRNSTSKWSNWDSVATQSELEQRIKSQTDTEVAWGASSHIDTLISPGVYNIKGERLNANDGLPIANSSPGHTIAAKLLVLDSSISGTGDSQDKCITQILMLSNRTGSDGNVYMRTGSAASKNTLNGGYGWSSWGKLQQNIEVGQVTSLNSFIGNGIYSGVYTNGSSFFETFVMVVINNYAVAGATGKVRSISQFKYALGVDGSFSYKTRIGHGNTGIEWGSWVDLGAASTTDIQDNSITVQKLSSDVREKVEKVPELEENATKEKNALVNGDTIVGLAREVYSRQGKTDTATFLKRTTAGGTSICDGVASIKQIGGNIVKNLVDGKFNNVTYDASYISVDIADGILKATGLQHSVYHSLSYKDTTKAEHLYYSSVLFYNYNAARVLISNSSGYNPTESSIRGEWVYLSVLSPIYQNFTSVVLRTYPEGDALPVVLFKNWLCIDLTEMYGAGNEPTKAECDKMFDTIDALPQGLTIAKPAEFKSVGYNQWNPVNLFTGKTVADNAIVDGDKSIAFFECLPCRVGAGENNGYVIGYGEGDDWSDAGIEVYLTPIYPMTGDGLLYAHKLEKDATTGTYVPKIKGYLLVVTPVTDKLCAHFLWSGDRAKTDYEEYIESTVSLPAIPQMSEWGLAGITAGQHDTIDLETNKFTKRVGCVDLGSLTWYKTESTRFTTTSLQLSPKITGNIQLVCDKFTVLSTAGFKETYMDLGVKDVIFPVVYDNNINVITSTEYASLNEFKEAVSGVKLYYELAEQEEYPIVAKAAPNYIGSDYGVEEFMGSKVPLVANILFYMRSLVSETRNFLDRLMAGLGVSDATTVADMIVAAVLPSQAIEPIVE